MASLNAMAKAAKTRKSSAPKKTSQKFQLPTSNLSTEFVQDSDIEQDEKSDATSSSDDEELLPENTAATSSKVNSKAAAPAVDNTSSSGSESESSGDSGSEDEEPRKVDEKVASESATPQSSKASTTKIVSFKETSPYKPPSGFELASLEDEASEASQLFKKSNLEGKQIWYMTAPASVPISSIKEISLAKVAKGNAVLSHNGNDYGFIQDFSEDITYTKVMVPRASDESYRAGAKSIDRILHLQQIVQIPSVYDANANRAASSTTARPTVPGKKPVRQQPPGLKMRFRPIGFGSGGTGAIGSSSSSADGSGSESASDEEMEDAPSHFRRPASLEAEESATSSDDSDDDSSSSSDAEMTEAPPLPSKPAVKTKSEKSASQEPPKVTEHPLKRKHSEGGDVETKHSSSSSETPTINRELKRIKKKQTNTLADRQSVSTETPQTKSSKLSQPIPTSATSVQAKAIRNHLPASSSHISPSPTKSALILPPKLSQMSPARTSQPSIAPPTSKTASETPSKDLVNKENPNAVDFDVKAKERKKEIKRMKKDNFRLLSKSDLEEAAITLRSGADAAKFNPVLAPFRNTGHRNDLNEPSVNQSQSLPRPISEEKRDSKDEKKEKKRRKAGMTNGRNEHGSVSSVYSHSPIPPPARSYSKILPPKSTPRR